MNGGVLHAVECMTVDEQFDTERGYRYFGFDDVASLMSRARKIFEAGDDLEYHEQQLDHEYAQLVPSDSSLAERFESRLKSRPQDFEMLRPKDRD